MPFERTNCMKNRVIGALLLCCMLITAIPVVTAAESVEANPHEDSAYDLEKLYVTDGLVAHFTVLGGNGNTVSLADGTWSDLVTGKVATLGNKQYWEKRADGAVGFDIFYGQMQADGTIVEAESTDNPLATDRYATNAPNTYAKTRLDFGIDLLPKDDFTVEYVAKYNPIYVGTAEGTIAKNSDGDPVEYYGATTHGLKNANLAGACDALGFFSSWATERDGTYDKIMTRRGSIFWMLSETLPTRWEEGTAWIGYDRTGAGGMRGDFHMKDRARSYAIMRDETLDEKDGGRVVKAIYSLWRDGANFKKSLTVSTANTLEGRIYYDKDDTGEFYLSSQLPTDFYGVRIYDRVLTADEMKQNRLIDLLLYYDISVAEELFADEVRMNALYSRVEDEGFAVDASRKEAIRAEMQAHLAGAAEKRDYASLYAAQDNLKSLFSTFDKESVNLESGTWLNLVGSAPATFGAKERWYDNGFGGVGFNTFCGQMTPTGGYTAESSANNYGKKAADKDAKLLFGADMLPESDFTVEYLAMYKPLYVYSAMAEDGIARDANGKPLETYDYDQTSVGQHLNYTPMDQLGWFTSYSLALDGVGNSQVWNTCRGALHWFFDCPTFYYNPTQQTNFNHNKNFLRDGIIRPLLDENGNQVLNKDGKPLYLNAEVRGLNIHNDVWRINDLVETYAITLDETLILHEEEDGSTRRETQGLFSLWRGSKYYNSNKNSINTTERNLTNTTGGAGANLYVDIDTPCETGSFFLSCTVPTDFFTVRIYDRVLTVEEMAHNRAIDLLYYYGAAFSDDLKNAPEVLASIVAQSADMSFEKDPAKMAANKAVLEGILSANVKCTVELTVEGTAYEQVSRFSDKMTLPSRIWGERVIAWQDKATGTFYAPDTEITVKNGMKLDALRIALPTLEKNATLKDVVDAEQTAHIGVQYAVTLSGADYDALCAVYGAEYLSFGLLIAPAEYVKLAGAFTREALRTMVDESRSVSRAAYIETRVTAPEKRADGSYVIAGTVYDFKENTLKKDPLFAVIGLIEIDSNKDGTADIVYYGNYVPMLNTTVSKTLVRERSKAHGEALEFIDALLSRFGA